MASSNKKKIAISEGTWKELGDMKQAGQTYDDLLQELIQEANRARLARKVRESRKKDKEDLVSLDEL